MVYLLRSTVLIPFIQIKAQSVTVLSVTLVFRLNLYEAYKSYSIITYTSCSVSTTVKVQLKKRKEPPHLPPVHFDVLSIEEEDGGRNESDVKVLDIHGHTVHINAVDGCHLGQLLNRLGQLDQQCKGKLTPLPTTNTCMYCIHTSTAFARVKHS